MALTKFRQFALLGLLSGYLLLNYAFMLLRIPPQGFGVPLGELFIFFAFFTINTPLVLKKIGSIAYLFPFLVWWGLGLARMLIDTADRGFWAVRDATSLIESLYIIIGFAVAGSPGFFERFMRWLPALLVIACIYAMGFQYQDEIATIMPSIPGVSADQPTPIIGTFDTSAAMLLWSAVYLLCAGQRRGSARVLKGLLACALIAFAVVVVQTRTIYTQLVGLAFIFVLFRRRSLAQMSLAVPLLVFVVVVVTAFDLHISGRLTDKISFSFFADHFLAIFGETSDDVAAAGANAAAGGVTLRMGWWLNLYERLTSDPVYLLIGLGYGVPLTNWVATGGTLVREPHNSFISLVSRLGVIGFIAWFWMFTEVARAWFGAFRRARQLHWHEGQDLLLQFLAFAALILIAALGEDAFEKPYNAIPLYCFLGITLRIAYMLRQRSVVTKSAPAPLMSPSLSAPAFTRRIERPEHSR